MIWRICICDVMHLSVWHDAFIYVTWLVQYVAWLIHRSWRTCMCDRTCSVIRLTHERRDSPQRTANRCYTLYPMHDEQRLCRNVSRCKRLQLAVTHCNAVQRQTVKNSRCAAFPPENLAISFVRVAYFYPYDMYWVVQDSTQWCALLRSCICKCTQEIRTETKKAISLIARESGWERGARDRETKQSGKEIKGESTKFQDEGEREHKSGRLNAVHADTNKRAHTLFSHKKHTCTQKDAERKQQQ